MEFFDKLTKKASEEYKVTADKTGKIAKETKLKLKMNELKSQISDLYEEIGKRVYEKHQLNEEISSEDLNEVCTKIDVLSDEIEGLLKQCLELKDKKQCTHCFAQIGIDDKFCPICGEKQDNQIQEKIEENQKEQDEKEQNNEEQNNEEQNSEEQDNAEQDNEEENDEEKNDEEQDSQKQTVQNSYEKTLEKTVEIEADPKIEQGENQEYIGQEDD